MISLVTYTYNDHDFVREQLRRAEALRPLVCERIVVDDGSAPPLRLEEPQFADVSILTHAGNKGPAAAKRTGLNAAAQDIILSVDCDVFFDRRWLLTALEYVSRADVGLVGGHIVNKDFGDPVSRAQYYESRLRTPQDPVRFVSGGLWLMRREVFRALGGLEDYAAPTHEDWHFCRKVTAAGLRIIVNTAFPVGQQRRLRRKSFVLRDCMYGERAYRGVFCRLEADKALTLIQKEVSDAVVVALRCDCPLLAYERVAKFIRVMGGIAGAYATRTGREYLGGLLTSAFAAYPQVLAALREDCDLPAAHGAGPGRGLA